LIERRKCVLTTSVPTDMMRHMVSSSVAPPDDRLAVVVAAVSVVLVHGIHLLHLIQSSKCFPYKFLIQLTKTDEILNISHLVN